MLTASIYKDRGESYSCRGISSRVDDVTLVNVSGPDYIKPTQARPPVILERGPRGSVRATVAVPDGNGGYVAAAGTSMGGTYVSTSDARMSEKVEELLGHRFYGAIALHDRIEDRERREATEAALATLPEE